MANFLKSFLGPSAMDRLREIDDRGSRFTQLLRDHRGEEAVGEFLGIVEYAGDWPQLHFEIIDYAVKREFMGDRIYPPLYKMLEKKPNDAKLLYVMGLVLQAINDQRAAAAAFEKAIEIRSDFAAAHHNLGIALSGSDLDRAIESLRTATRLDPRMPEAHFALGSLLLRAGRRKEGIDAFRRFAPLAYPHLEAFKNQALLEIAAYDKQNR
jgi:tetratricopeptide (TPR) repeat protein